MLLIIRKPSNILIGIEGDEMKHTQCLHCGYEDYFEVEEETDKLYCLYCGYYYGDE